MKRPSRRKEPEEKGEKKEATEEKGVSETRRLRRAMCEKILGSIDKGIADEARELARYAPYTNSPEFVNPWGSSEIHGVSNDVATILAALEDQ